MAQQLKMLAIGTAMQDVFLQAGHIFKPLCDHGICFEHLPLGAKLDVDQVVFSTGGNALNAATTFARQGLDTYFMGILGTEPSAEIVMRTMDQEGIDSRYVHQDKAYATGYSTILLAPTGERTALTYHGTPLRPDGSDLNMDGVAQADWLYISSLGTMELLHKIVTIAKKHNTKIAMNPSNRELEQGAKLRSLLEDVDVLLLNKEEMAMVFEGKSSEELLRHAAHLVPTAVLSDGPKGVLATDGTKLVKAGMYEDVKVKSRLGAGDAFGSGFVAMHAQGKTLEESVTFASANATSVVTMVGATKGLLHKGAPLHSMPLTVTDL